MKHLIILSSSVALLAGCASQPCPDTIGQINQKINAAPTAGGKASFNDNKNTRIWAKGYILVQPRAGLAKGKFDSVIKAKGGRRALGKVSSLSSVHRIEVPEESEVDVIRALSKDPNIKFAERDMLVQLSEVIPDDPKYNKAWHLPMLQASFAWQYAQGDGITIAILDTGVYGDHPDLNSKMVDGWNIPSGNSDTSDIHGHGTAVSGTAAAASNNALGVASIGWNAQIMPIRITNRTDGYAYWSDIAAGLYWAADHGAQVANISYNISHSATISQAAQYMRNHGGVVVAAAGNDGHDSGYADNPYIITVAATNKHDVKAHYSNYGDFLDVAAPGDYILTTNRSGGYSSWRGTSFASPVTAGVVALIMSAKPELTPDQVETILEDSADDLVDGSDWHTYYGNGRVNAAAAVELALDITEVDTQAPQVSIFSPSTNSEVQGTIQIEINASDNSSVSEVILYANGQEVASDTTAPYQFSWDSTQALDGPTTLSASAIDAANNEGVSSDVVVTVANHPTESTSEPAPETDTTAPDIDIISPEDGGDATPSVKIKASATDNIKVTSMRLYIDDVLRSKTRSNRLVYRWSTRRSVSSGVHTIRAVAFDAAGNSSETQIQITK